MAISEEWSIPCLADNEELEPTPNELDAMYKKLSAGETFELSWKCTGRRLPTPVQVADTEVKNNSNTAKWVFRISSESIDWWTKKYHLFVSIAEAARIWNLISWTKWPHQRCVFKDRSLQPNLLSKRKLRILPVFWIRWKRRINGCSFMGVWPSVR